MDFSNMARDSVGARSRGDVPLGGDRPRLLFCKALISRTLRGKFPELTVCTMGLVNGPMELYWVFNH